MSSLIAEATIKIRQDSASNWTSTNPTPLQGEWCLETDTGNIKIGDGSTAWTSLEYRQQLPFTYDLTSANVTHTLPIITGYPQTEEIYWTNGGTYKLTLAVSDSETVGGIAASTWEGEGEGHITLTSDGTNWQVREYEDWWEDVNTDKIYKYRDGTMKQIVTILNSSPSWLSSAGGNYYAVQTKLLPKSSSFGNLRLVSSNKDGAISARGSWIINASTTSSTITVYWGAPINTSGNLLVCIVNIDCRWRA